MIFNQRSPSESPVVFLEKQCPTHPKSLLQVGLVVSRPASILKLSGILTYSSDEDPLVETSCLSWLPVQGSSHGFTACMSFINICPDLEGLGQVRLPSFNISKWVVCFLQFLLNQRPEAGPMWCLLKAMRIWLQKQWKKRTPLPHLLSRNLVWETYVPKLELLIN